MDFNLKNKRVLLVEDNRINRELSKEILEEEGMIVEEAVNGLQAVEKIKDSMPGYYNFVLMDIRMPVMDGYTAAREIRKLDNKELAKLPIIAMTVNSKDEEKMETLDAGMNAHLVKPVKIPDLMETIRDMVSSYEDLEPLFSALV